MARMRSPVPVRNDTRGEAAGSESATPVATGGEDANPQFRCTSKSCKPWEPHFRRIKSLLLKKHYNTDKGLFFPTSNDDSESGEAARKPGEAMRPVDDPAGRTGLISPPTAAAPGSPPTQFGSGSGPSNGPGGSKGLVPSNGSALRREAHNHLHEKLEVRMRRMRSGQLSMDAPKDAGGSEVELSRDPVLGDKSEYTATTDVLHPTRTTFGVELMAGVMSGSLQVLLFNPYDRALYLSMVNHRKFFDRRNWGGSADLNKGLLPNLMQRIVSYGMYFPIEQMWTRMLLPERKSPWNRCGVWTRMLLPESK